MNLLWLDVLRTNFRINSEYYVLVKIGKNIIFHFPIPAISFNNQDLLIFLVIIYTFEIIKKIYTGE